MLIFSAYPLLGTRTRKRKFPRMDCNLAGVQSRKPSLTQKKGVVTKPVQPGIVQFTERQSVPSHHNSCSLKSLLIVPPTPVVVGADEEVEEASVDAEKQVFLVRG